MDPRSIFLHMIYQANIWYDCFMIPILFISLVRRFNRDDSMYLPLPFMAIEVIRICLNSGHTHGNIVVSIVFIVFDIIALILDFLNIFLVDLNTSFFNLIFIAFIVFHILQLLTIIPVFKSLRYYKFGFYQFSRVQLQKQDEDDTVQLMDIEQQEH